MLAEYKSRKFIPVETVLVFQPFWFHPLDTYVYPIYNRESRKHLLIPDICFHERWVWEESCPLPFQPNRDIGIRFLKEEESYRFVSRFHISTNIIFYEYYDCNLFKNIYKNTDDIYLINLLLNFWILSLWKFFPSPYRFNFHFEKSFFQKLLELLELPIDEK